MFSDPEKIVDQLGLEESTTAIAADLGAGSGAYTIALAKRLKDSGKVYAVEVQKDLVARLKNLAINQGLSNVEVVWGDIERQGATKLADRSVDLVTIANTVFQVEDKEGMVGEVKRILKPGGRVLVVDWTSSFGGLGPEQSAVVSAKDAQDLFERGGFSFEKNIDAGANHYGLFMRKSGAVSAAFENKFTEQA